GPNLYFSMKGCPTLTCLGSTVNDSITGAGTVTGGVTTISFVRSFEVRSPLLAVTSTKYFPGWSGVNVAAPSGNCLSLTQLPIWTLTVEACVAFQRISTGWPTATVSVESATTIFGGLGQ